MHVHVQGYVQMTAAQRCLQHWQRAANSVPLFEQSVTASTAKQQLELIDHLTAHEQMLRKMGLAAARHLKGTCQ
jgi:hypothetical protein